MVESSSFRISSKGHLDIINITDNIQRIVDGSKINNGIATIFVPGSTGAITTIEYEDGLKRDIKEHLEKLFPYGAHYHHHNTWGDDNGSGHIQSALLKTSFVVPVINKTLTLGTWQQIIFCECDTRSRSREIIVQLIGE